MCNNMKELLFDKEDLFPAFEVALEENYTSLQRYQQLINQSEMIKRYSTIDGIFNVSVKQLEEPFNVNLMKPIFLEKIFWGSIENEFNWYFKNYENKQVKFDNNLLISKNQLAIAYIDGGVEYLDAENNNIDPNNPQYHCKLWTPSTNSVLSYSHDIKRSDLVSTLRRVD